MTPKPDAYAEFLRWCDGEGIRLSQGQIEAAAPLLSTLRSVLGGRGSGKTYLLDAIDRFTAARPDLFASP